MASPNPVLELRVAITVDDYDAAIRFYRDQLGLPLMREFGEDDGKGAILSAGVVATIEIVSRAEADAIDVIETGKPGGAPLRLALEVADSVEIAAKLDPAPAPPVETPWGHRNVRLTSPGGIPMTLFTVFRRQD